MQFINALAILLFYQLMGEMTVRYLAFPVPGPVLGMLMLFATLLIRNRLYDTLEKTAAGLLGHLSLLFVPAGVGIMVHWEHIADEWLAIGVALVLSTVITLLGSAGIMIIANRLTSSVYSDSEASDD